MAKLVFQDPKTGQMRHVTLSFIGGPVSVGRNKSNVVAIKHRSISRYHGRLRFENGEHYYDDLKSSNGSFVNGERIMTSKLEDGTKLRLGVDVLVNNAGVSYRSVIEHISTDEHHRQLDINYLGPMALAALVLPCMRRKRAGRIIQISSASGFMAMPTMGLYTASKFALEGATEALYYEVRPFGIKVSLVLPGFINSDGFEKVVWTERGCEAGNDHHDPYHPHYRHMSDFVGTIMKRAISTPESVAHTVVRTMNARWPKLRVPGTLDMRVLYSLRKLLPQRVYHELLYRMLPGLRHWGTNAVPIEASRPLLTAPSVVLPRETSTPTRTLPE